MSLRKLLLAGSTLLLACPNPPPTDEAPVSSSTTASFGTDDGSASTLLPSSSSDLTGTTTPEESSSEASDSSSGSSDSCGDGQINEGEVCDDGENNGRYDFCNTECSGPGPTCGDGVVDPEEACDDDVNDGSYGGCAPDCQSLGPRCGDGGLQGSEVCDDGNDEPGDGCNPDCTVSASEVWSRTFDVNPWSGYPAEVIVRGNEEILVAADGPTVAAFDPANGDTLWSDSALENGVVVNATPYDIVLDGDGVSVTGLSETVGSEFQGWLAYVENGVLTPSTTLYADVGQIFAVAIIGDTRALVGSAGILGGTSFLYLPDGSSVENTGGQYTHVALAGDGALFAALSGYDDTTTLQHYDAKGTLDWTLDLDVAEGFATTSITEIVVLEDGSAVLSGARFATSLVCVPNCYLDLGSSAYLARVSSAGLPIWETLERGYAFYDLAVDPVSEDIITVAAFENESAQRENRLSKYTDDGVLRWTVTDSELGFDDVNLTRTAVLPERDIIVAGTSFLARLTP